MKKFLALALFLPTFFLAGCGSGVSNQKNATSTNGLTNKQEIIATSTEVSETLSLSNPASVNCITLKGTLKTVTRTDGNQYNICYFMDNRQCEEWALLRGECPVNGRKITGYDTEEQRYCAITGGEVDMDKNTCTFKGKACNLEKYYNGTCNE